MSDIQTVWDAVNQRGDWAVAGGSLSAGLDVQTSVLLSLFTDRLADADDAIPDAPPSGLPDRRGWWGDDDPKYIIGSRLWLLDRAKGPLNLAQRAEDYAREALQWMLDDSVVAKFDIQASWVPQQQLFLQVTAYRSDGGIVSNIAIDLWSPANLPDVIVASAVNINNIGLAGAVGFGVGICPAVPVGFNVLAGTNLPASDQYGNYQYSDGSIMVWIPAFYYKYGTGANGLAINMVSIKALSAYTSVDAANADGYAVHRAFYDNGFVQLGVFVDKYKCSNNAGTASSIQFGNPISSNNINNPFSGLTGAPSNSYAGAIAAAKTRGANFFSSSLFIRAALAMLALAHSQASTSTNSCAWYDASGVNNFPKGCNNNALGDVNDGTLTFVATGNATYTTANKTGSANVLAKTTHNGQNCGVADVNGTMWEISIGLTSDAVDYYILKTSASMKAITAGDTLATDGWGALGIAANYDNLGATFGALTNSSTVKYFGSATQVLDAAINGNAWNAAGAGIPLVGGVGGTNAFGQDGLWDYMPNEMCPRVAGAWYNGSTTGMWALVLVNTRGDSGGDVGFRAALYL